MKKSTGFIAILVLIPVVLSLIHTPGSLKVGTSQPKQTNEIWSDRIYKQTVRVDCQPTEYRTNHAEELTKRSHEIYTLLSPHTNFNGSPWIVVPGVVLDYSESTGGQAMIFRYTLPKIQSKWLIASLNIYWINSTFEVNGTDYVRFVVYYDANNETDPSAVSWKTVLEGSDAWLNTYIEYEGWYSYTLSYGNKRVDSANQYLWIRVELSDTSNESGTTYNATVGKMTVDPKPDPAEWIYAGSYNAHTSSDMAVEVVLTADELASDYYQFIDLKFANDNYRMLSYMRIYPLIPVENESSRWEGLELIYKFAYGSTTTISENNNTGVLYIIKKGGSSGVFYDVSWNHKFIWEQDSLMGLSEDDFLVDGNDAILPENDSRIIEFMTMYGNTTEFNVSILQPIKMEIELKHYYSSDSPYPYYRDYIYPAEVELENYGFSNKIYRWATLYLAGEDYNAPRIYMTPTVNNMMAATYFENNTMVGAIYAIMPDQTPQVLVFSREPVNESGIQYVEVSYMKGFHGSIEKDRALLPMENVSWEYTTYRVLLESTFEPGEIVFYNVTAVDWNENIAVDTNNGSMYCFMVANPYQSRFYELDGSRTINATVVGVSSFVVSSNTSWALLITKTNTTLTPSKLGVTDRRMTQFATFSINSNTSLDIQFTIQINAKELKRNFYDLSMTKVYIRNFYTTTWFEVPGAAYVDEKNNLIHVHMKGTFRAEVVVVIFREPDPIAETVIITGFLLLAIIGVIFLYKKLSKTEEHWDWGVVRYGTPF